MTAEIHTLPVRLADCLKLCYLLRERGEALTSQAVQALSQVREPAEQLSGSVVTRLFEQLHSRGYVSYTRYRGVEFTEAGEKAAAELVRHHRLLELFLVRILKLPLDQANMEAERLEHVISEVIEERIDTLLNHPSEDPHGDPIPDMMGRVYLTPTIALSEIPVGQSVSIHRIIAQDGDLVRYLETLQLIPGTVVRLDARTSYGDVLTLSLGETNTSVSNAVAQHVLVRVLQEDSSASDA